MQPGIAVAIHVQALLNQKQQLVQPERDERALVQGEPHRVGHRREEQWVVLDFAQKERQTFDLQARTVEREPLHALVAARALELPNRRHIGQVLAAGGVVDNDFQDVLIEHQLAVQPKESKTTLGARSVLSKLTRARPGIEPVQKNGQSSFVALGRTLLSHSPDSLRAPTAPLVHFVRSDFGGHPLLLRQLAARDALPRSLTLGAWMPMQSGGEVTLRIEESKTPLVLPAVRDFADALPSGSEPIDAILRSEAWKTTGASIEDRLTESLALMRGSNPIDGALAFFELSLEQGTALPPDLAAAMNQSSDPPVQLLIALLTGKVPPEEAVRVFEVLRPEAGPRAYLLGAFEAATRLSLNQPQEASRLLSELLAQNPRVTGAYKDLGDLYVRDFDTSRGWACYRRARQIAPHFSTLRDVTTFEQQLEAAHPEYFRLDA